MPEPLNVPYDPNETTFEEDITIDKYNLDVECERQPTLYEKWSRKWAIANGRMEQIKAKRDLVEARLDSDVRFAPESFGITGRVTEQAIKVAIKQHADYIEVNSELQEASLLTNVLTGAKWAMEHKKEMIDGLIRLYGSQYFAKPTITQQIAQEAPTQRTVKQIENLKRRRPITTT